MSCRLKKSTWSGPASYPTLYGALPHICSWIPINNSDLGPQNNLNPRFGVERNGPSLEITISSS